MFCKGEINVFTARNGCRKPAAVTLVCPSMTVRGTLVEGHLFLGGKGLSQFHKTTICTGKAHGDGQYYVAIHRYALVSASRFLK